MLNKTNNQTKESRSLKEIIVENKHKVLTGVSIVMSAGCIYLIGKEISIRRLELDINSQLICDNVDRLNKIEQILNEGGVLNQAIATITGKRDRLNSKLLRYINKPGSPENDKIIEQCKSGIEEFNKMLEGCDFIKFCCEYTDGVQKLLDEE